MYFSTGARGAGEDPGEAEAREEHRHGHAHHRYQGGKPFMPNRNGAACETAHQPIGQSIGQPVDHSITQVNHSSRSLESISYTRSIPEDGQSNRSFHSSRRSLDRCASDGSPKGRKRSANTLRLRAFAHATDSVFALHVDMKPRFMALELPRLRSLHGILSRSPLPPRCRRRSARCWCWPSSHAKRLVAAVLVGKRLCPKNTATLIVTRRVVP